MSPSVGFPETRGRAVHTARPRLLLRYCSRPSSRSDITKSSAARLVTECSRSLESEVGGPVRVNTSSQPEGSSKEKAVAELNRLGLEHFGFNVADLEAEIDRFEKDVIQVVLPVTSVSGGTKLAYIEGPDGVLIELVERP